MKVTVKLFASYREAVGEPQQVVQVRSGSTVGELWDALIAAHPRLGPMSASPAFALNGRYARADAALREGDVVAFLPPVSGG